VLSTARGLKGEAVLGATIKGGRAIGLPHLGKERSCTHLKRALSCDGSEKLLKMKR
jgi:hypothetical protein